MPDENTLKQQATPIDFSTLNDVPSPDQLNDLVIHIPTAFASSPMVPPDYQLTRNVPRQLQSHTDSTRH
jgi:hypothetical protein